MRIAIVSWNRRRIAGTETYLSRVIPELHRLGHTLAFWHERDEPLERERIELPDESQSWCVAELGGEAALTALREWRPDLIYAHGLTDPALEAAAIKIAPSIFFAHNYHGNCISGAKTFKSPVAVPCSRRFGWQCLLHFYPHRCGGLNPVTTWRQYRLQSNRHEVLHRYNAIVVFSEHMQKEYAKYGLNASLAYTAPDKTQSDEFTLCEAPNLEVERSVVNHAEIERKSYWQLVFLGRMEFVKGGHVFLDALTHLNGDIDRPMRIVFAGDGPERPAWERKAEQVRRLCPRLTIDFTSWMNEREVDQLLGHSDLLVLPSLWPEPFGLAVIEAGRHGVPVAAFAVGGIPQWLTDGVNGYLAPQMPPTAAGLAEAIRKCLTDPANHSKLRRGAVQVAARFNLENHVRVLDEIFERVGAEGKLEE